jgi:phage recombination protein Bet
MSTAVQLYSEPQEGAVTTLQFSQTQLDLLKSTIAKGTTDEQFSLFVEVAQRTGLNPFAKQIYAVVRNTKEGDKWVPTMTIQTGVDGYRLIAQRSGDYAGQRGPEWCGDDGVWRGVWLEKGPPSAARVGVLRHGFAEPVWGVATVSSYMQTTRDGGPQGLWRSMPDVMIAKCAEVLALRKAFPQELSGVYADVEMEQADRPISQGASTRPAVRQPQSRSARAALADTRTGELASEAAQIWNKTELTEKLKSAGLTVKDLGLVLGGEITRDNYVDRIDGYFADHTAKSLDTIVEETVAAKYAQTDEARSAPSDTGDAPELPFEDR